MIVTIAAVQEMHVGKNVVVWKKDLDKLPYTIGGMQGIDVPLEASVARELGTDVYVFRNYTSADGRVINVYIGYYGTRREGDPITTPKDATLVRDGRY